MQMPITKPPPYGKLAHRLHYGRELGNGAGAKVVAKGEASGDDDGIAVLEVLGMVPKERGFLLGHVLDGPEGIMIAVWNRGKWSLIPFLALSSQLFLSTVGSLLLASTSHQNSVSENKKLKDSFPPGLEDEDFTGKILTT